MIVALGLSFAVSCKPEPVVVGGTTPDLGLPVSDRPATVPSGPTVNTQGVRLIRACSPFPSVAGSKAPTRTFQCLSRA